MDALRLDFGVPLRSFELGLALDIGRETVALVGPSGAGKSTVLRAIAGLMRPGRGRIELDGEVLFDAEAGIDLPPEQRRVGLVFQEYALFPHMTVAQNVEYGGQGTRRRAARAVPHLPSGQGAAGQLSGGERQRVGLARALARGPRVLLMDEPLSALDAHTRANVRAELQELLRHLALPTLLVTHDFEDAAALADRVGVIVEGRVLQLGPPPELVAAPVDPFVASFTGGNLLRGHATARANGLTEVALEDGTILYSVDPAVGSVGLVVYPWEVSVARQAVVDSALNHVAAPISSLVPLGNRVRVRIGPLVAEVTAESADQLALERGETVVASFKATATRLVPLA